MHPGFWLEHVLGTRARIRILRSLFAQPGRWWTERELAAEVGMSPNTVSLAARDLLGTGLVSFQRLGRSNGVRLRDDLAVVDTLARLFAAERETLKRVEAEIARALPAGTVGYVYGSTARAEAGPESDLDVAIVAPTRAAAEEARARALSAAAGVTPRPPNFVAFDRREFERRKPSGVVSSILREGRVLRGTEAEP